MTKEFRSPRWIKVATVIAALLFVLSAVAIWRTQGLSLMSVIAVGLAVFAVVAVFATWLDRITLTEENLVMVSNLRRRVFARDSIVGVSWAKGCPVSIEFADGHWQELPPVGPGNQSVGMTLRWWIARQHESDRCDPPE